MIPRVSVVVPTYRRPELLSRCLAALAAQDLEPSQFEVLIADNGASAETQALVEKWAGQFLAPVRYLAAQDGRGPAAARNSGWRAARGEVIAFTDDDCVPTPNWLREGLAALPDGVAALMGRVVMPLPPTPTDYERDAAGLERAGFVTANCFCRRAALASVGGFDERFTAAWREDSDLFFALLENGYRVERAPGAVVVHPIRPAPWGVSLEQQRKNRFNALLYKKHPHLYRRYIQALPPVHYYVLVAALLLGLAGLALGERLLPLLALGIWLTLTVRFCCRRLRHTSRAPRHVAEMVVTSILIPPLAIYWRLRGAWQFHVFFL